MADKILLVDFVVDFTSLSSCIPWKFTKMVRHDRLDQRSKLEYAKKNWVMAENIEFFYLKRFLLEICNICYQKPSIYLIKMDHRM
jgi:hypothetical protein